LALLELSILSAKISTWRYSSRMKVFLAPYSTKLIEKYGSYSFSFTEASMSLFLNVVAHFYLLVILSVIISIHAISLTTSSLCYRRDVSRSSSSSTTPLNALAIFLQPLIIYFLRSLSSILASLNLKSIEFSLLIL